MGQRNKGKGNKESKTGQKLSLRWETIEGKERSRKDFHLRDFCTKGKEDRKKKEWQGNLVLGNFEREIKEAPVRVSGGS